MAKLETQALVKAGMSPSMARDTVQQAIQQLDIVDDTICGLLFAIDQELLQLSFTTSTGETLNLVSVASDYGELCGSYGPGTRSGWMAQYSKERFARDLSDLDDMFSK